MQKLAFINGFRALAALWVVVAHCTIWAGWLGPPLPSAKLAVDLFIIISGYLMMLHATERETIEPMASPVSWLKFYVRRFFRLAPTYYLVLAIVVCAAPIFLGGYQVLHDQHPYMVHEVTYNPKYYEYTPRSIVLHASFLFGLIPQYAHSTFLPDWSLSLEMQFYAVFPALFLFAKRFGWYRMAFYLYFPCQYIIDRVSYMSAPRGGPLYPDPSVLPLKLHYFMVGMLIAMTGMSSVARHHKMWMWLYVLSIVLYDVWLYGSPYVLILILAIVMLYATTFSESWLRQELDKISSRSAVVFLSRMSYAAYLFHGLAIASVGYFLFSRPDFATLSYQSRTVIMVCIVVPITYMISYLSERYVEVPGISVGKKIINSFPDLRILRLFPRGISGRQRGNL